MNGTNTNAGSVNTPRTLMEAVQFFSDLDRAHAYFAKMRWPDGQVCCPRCGLVGAAYMPKYRRYQCAANHDARQFTLKTGTIMEDSPLGLDKWAVAFWLEVNAKNSISSYEIHRALGITQKSAWFMLHRIRLATNAGSFDKKLCGVVEADETFIGGKARNMHPGKRKAKGRGAIGKAVVMGLLERHTEKGKSQVRTHVVDNTKRKSLQPVIRSHVEPGSEIHTDALPSYNGLAAEYVHQVVDHAEAYVRGTVHTNGLENFWSLFKRCIKGTHVSVEPFHLFRYLDSEGFRFNERDLTDGERFALVLKGIAGKRLTYKSLIGEEGIEPSVSGEVSEQ